jgi:hypothetical protein
MSANAEAAVTQGALSAIYNNQPAENPVFQCVQLKPMGSGAGGVERYRLVWSDIRNYIQSMLATQLNHIVNEGKLKRGVFVRLKQFQQQEVKGKRYVWVSYCSLPPSNTATPESSSSSTVKSWKSWVNERRLVSHNHSKVAVPSKRKNKLSPSHSPTVSRRTTSTAMTVNHLSSSSNNKNKPEHYPLVPIMV